MAEAFLDNLLQINNSVPWGDRECVICHSETGTMSRTTGYLELLIRLPCGHVVGSGCVARWFKEENSCPFCRREFFAAQPRPHLEHGIAEDQDDENHEVEDPRNNGQELRSRLALIDRLCLEHCNRLPLTNSYRIGVFSQRLAEDYASRPTWAHYSADVIAAASVYLACTFVSRVTSDPNLVAAAAVNLAQATIDETQLSIIDEIFGGSDGIQRILEAFLESLPQTR